MSGRRCFIENTGNWKSDSLLSWAKSKFLQPVYVIQDLPQSNTRKAYAFQRIDKHNRFGSDIGKKDSLESKF